MQDQSREDQFSSELDGLDMIESDFYEQGGEYEDPEDMEDIDEDGDEHDDNE